MSNMKPAPSAAMCFFDMVLVFSQSENSEDGGRSGVADQAMIESGDGGALNERSHLRFPS
jgi:hypothetical protein